MQAMVKKILSYTLFPSTFLVGMGIAIWATYQEHNLIPYVIIITLAMVLVVFLGEKFMPYYKEWSQPRGDRFTDFIHNIVSALGPTTLFKWTLLGALYSVNHWATQQIGFNLWPKTWPIVAQLALACVISEFGLYWFHRLTHQNSFFWKFHVVHHSPERLYWMNAAREHPLGTLVFYFFEVCFLLLLGASEQVIALESLITSIVGVWQHANINVKLGPLNYIFSMSEVHRWHHSKNLKEANTNFGSNFVIWDHVFGTFFWPKDRNPPVDVGLGDIREFPKSYWGQLTSIFKLEKLRS